DSPVEMIAGRWARPLRTFGLLLLATVSNVQALDPNRSLYQYNAQTWRRANGLPANAVSAIAQTVDGKMWLGTSQGLVAFDGVGFRVLDPTSNSDIAS